MKETSRLTDGQVKKLDTQTDKKAKAPTRQAGSSLERPRVSGRLMEGKHTFPILDVP